MNLEIVKTKVGKLIEKAKDAGGGNTDELEAIIDNSGVLDSTEGTVEEKVEQLVDKAEWEDVWYVVSQSLESLRNAFKDVDKVPRIKPTKCTNFLYTFDNKKLESIDFLIETETIISADYAFYRSTNLKHIKGIKPAGWGRAVGLFYQSGIEVIEEPFDFSNMNTNLLQNAFNCSNLREVRFVSDSIKWSITFTSAVLSAESIQSIIDGLATVETVQTLTLNSTVTANLTAEQMIQIANKNWTTG
jgi:hypothetical protein